MAATREKVIRAAEKYVARGKIEAAIREYRKVLSDQPRDTNTLNRVGDLYARIDRIDEAVGLFSQIAEQYAEEGFFVKAIAIYKKIIKLDPIRLEVYQALAELYHRQGLVNEARSQYQVLADYYQKHGDLIAAEAICRRMIDLEPRNPSHHAKLADVLEQREMIEEAMAEYAIVARQLIEAGQPGEARRVFEKALDLDAEALEFIGDAVHELRDADGEQAERFLATARERNPNIGAFPKRAKKAEPAAEAPSAAVVEEAPVEAQVEEDELATDPAVTEPTGPADLEPIAAAESAGEIDFDLESDEVPDSQVTPPPEYAGEFTIDLDLDERDGILDLDTDLLERTASELVVKPAEKEEDLLTEAEVLAKYGLEDKALERLNDLFEVNPENLDGAALRISIHLSAGRFRKVFFLANEMASIASDLKQPEPWGQVREQLLTHGFLLDGDRVVSTPEEDIAGGEPDGSAWREPEEKPPTYTAPPPAADRVRPPPSNLVVSARDELDHILEGAAERQDEVFYDEDLLHGRDLVPEEPRSERPVIETGASTASEVSETPPPAEAAGPQEELAEEAPSVEPPVAAGPPATAEPPAHSEVPVEAPAGDEPAAEPPPRRRPERLGDIDAALAAIRDEVLSAPPAPAAASADPGTEAMAESAEAEETAAPPPDAEAPPSESAPVFGDELAAGLEDSLSWLDDVRVAGEAEVDDKIFAGEEGFFDLAAELEQELSDEDVAAGEAFFSPPREQTLEEIVEGFKRGVAESLSAEDYETHFNLGIAYREMGLLDEAIGEFQLAAKATDRLVECASMLGLCFLDKGLPELAVKWYRRGLDAPDLPEGTTLGLLYDLGNTYLAAGDEENARRTFVDIYGVNSNYRDVVAKLEELG